MLPPAFSPAPAGPLPANRRAYALLLALFLLSVLMCFITEGTYDSGDSINHYLFARYAFEHPINFLESWSKPLVVELMALPAQLGLRAVMVLQCVLVAAAAWLAYGAARALRLPWPWLAILFCYASPDYFRIQFSGLTEPTFALVLMAGVALVLQGRVSLGAAIVSFLPFARSEGFILLGLFGLYLLLSRHWRALPWLGLGFVVYGVAGLFVYQDFLWVFTHNAYPTRNENYGHGQWPHFILSLPGTIGWVLYALFWIGGFRMLWEWSKPTARLRPEKFTAELLLVYGNVVVFIGAHTIFWTFGIFGSFGLTRVLCCVVPLISLIALRGVATLAGLARSEQARHRIRVVLAVAVVGLVFSGMRAGLRWERDFGRASDQILADEAATWALRQGRPPHVVFQHPYFALPLQTDPFGPQYSHIPAVREKSWPLPVGTLVFWDEWYAVLEGQVPLNDLRNDPQYRLRWQRAMPRNRRKPTADSVRMAIFEKVQ
ncbi:hypothetical protein HNQ93_000427 [Hymenobacter luteus]|uniref:Glycosyltransferase RgtA/B/C/D-like domain-containing protein n=2 Tax=Hymenobacter TaxID=89966 RepID=A0A7W9SX92_9BACT|nr:MULTISPECIES: hypothetical protein [Hymenobacter]MBB4600093.1 hypothetical protein [Hymenobacter latericoloratus]MBB6057597.1 hypothetical protein [Hymenobacter luteus]